MAGFLAAHDFEQLHDVGGREEVHAHDIAGALGRRGDLVHIEIAGVGGKDRALLHHFVELGEDLFLDVHVFVDRLDHEIAIGEVAIGQRGRQQAHGLFDLLGRHAAFLGRVFIVLAHYACAPVECVLGHFEDRHRNTGGEEIHRDPAAHGSGPDHADFLDRDQRRILGHVVDLVGGAFGEEIVAHRRALRAAHQFHEQLAFLLHAFGIGQLASRLDRFDRRIGGIETANPAGLAGAEAVEQVGIAHPIFIGIAFRRTRDRLADLRPGESDGIGLEAVFTYEFVEQTDGLGFLGRDRIAADD